MALSDTWRTYLRAKQQYARAKEQHDNYKARGMEDEVAGELHAAQREMGTAFSKHMERQAAGDDEAHYNNLRDEESDDPKKISAALRHADRVGDKDFREHYEGMLPRSDTQKDTLAKLGQAKSPKPPPAAKSTQTGKRGGVYVLTAGGSKVYLKK